MTVRHMDSHRLNHLKGWPSQTAVDISYPIAAAAKAAVAPNPVWAGSCMHLTDDLELGLGCQTVAGRIMMPIFIFHNSDDPDVQNDGGITGDADADDPEGWVGVKRNNMLGFPAAGAYELETTEFVDAEYTPNQPLQATTANAGKVSAGTVGSQQIVGIVSRGKKRSTQSHASRYVLAFWPYCLPPVN